MVRTDVRDETFGGVTYHIQGELAPQLVIEMDGETPVYFEHHTLLWKDPAVRIGFRALKGAFKRIIAGMQIFMTEAGGRGAIAFSRNGAGQVVPVHLEPGQAVDVREHQFLAATGHVGYGFTFVKGIANILFGGTGFFVDRFTGGPPGGIVWLHAYGNMLEKTLGPGEAIDVEPGAWVYKDPGVRMQTVALNLSAGLFGANVNLAINRFTGPGRVGIQTVRWIPTSK